MYEVFAGRGEAYSAEELFEEVDAPLMVEEFETALEDTRPRGALEKRMYPAHADDDERVTYYRASDAGADGGSGLDD